MVFVVAVVFTKWFLWQHKAMEVAFSPLATMKVLDNPQGSCSLYSIRPTGKDCIR